MNVFTAKGILPEDFAPDAFLVLFCCTYKTGKLFSSYAENDVEARLAMLFFI